MIFVKAFTRYDRLGASSRVRMLQFSTSLASHDISISFYPLFPDSYIEDLQKGRRNKLIVLIAYLRRVYDIILLNFSQDKVDLIWIEKEFFPWMPAILEKLFWSSHIPIVLDYDDAVFHSYDKHRNLLVRTLLSSKHSNLMSHAAMVFVGNDYLKDYAIAAKARRVEIIPTVIDLSRYKVTIAQRHSEIPCVVWIGQASTAKYLQDLLPVLNNFQLNGSLIFKTIGFKIPDSIFECIPWSESTESYEISNFDIGIMPLFDDYFERGKCGYKLIQYMACGLPVIASPVGINSQLVAHGVSGFLASSADQWSDSLKTLIVDRQLRISMGAAGRVLVEENYCIAVVSRKIAFIFHDIVFSFRN
jgi:glycosyltransferase involved in cell wall biosynthesis